jgi:hypothetical protein
MNSIEKIPNKNFSDYFWKEDEYCSGFTVSDTDCNLRYNEMQLISYTPLPCLDGTFPDCSRLVAYARFDIQS